GIRSIKLAAELKGVSRPIKVIGITSTLPGEGKSTIAASLAQLTSCVGRRTILVDCDLRNPSLTRVLAPGAKSGILDVIAGKAPLEDVVWTDPATKLTFLPAAAKARIAHTSEILGSEAMKRLFEKLRQSYDSVVVDFSPLAPVV